MEKFDVRLRALMDARPEVDYDDVVASLSSKATMRQYLSGRCMPRARNLFVLGQKYHVSTAYLLGLTDDMSYADYDDKYYVFSDRLKLLYDDLITPELAAGAIGVPETTLHDMLYREFDPTVWQLLRICDVFCVSPLYMLGEIDKSYLTDDIVMPDNVRRKKSSKSADSVFHKRLLQAVTTRQVSCRELSLRLGKSSAYTHKVISCGVYPSPKTVADMCIILQISADWLFGLHNEMYLECKQRAKPMERLHRLAMDKRAMKRASEISGMRVQVIYKIMDVESMRSNYLPRLAEGFDVSVDYLLGLSDERRYVK